MLNRLVKICAGLFLLFFSCCSAEEHEPAMPCPPVDSFGYDVGSKLFDLEFTDCQGQDFSLHELCGEKASLIFNFYGWCPGCRRTLAEINNFHDIYEQHGLSVNIFVSQDELTDPATLAYCQALVERYGIAPRTFIDPEAQLESYGDAGLVMIVDDRATIVFKRQDATLTAIENAIREALGL